MKAEAAGEERPASAVRWQKAEDRRPSLILHPSSFILVKPEAELAA
jgi:hypothetical protein